MAGDDKRGHNVTRRIFVSHTAELRQFPQGGSYVDAVERAISACGYVIVDMADFPAAGLPPAELCAERVRSCDVSVGVLGTRYGSPVQGRPDVSYAELEFEVATAEGLDRLVFTLDTEAETTGMPASGLIDLQFGERQAAFRCRVQEGGLVTASFSSPDMLGRLVERSLRDLDGPPRTGVAGGLPVRVAPRPAFLAGREGLLGVLDSRLKGEPGQSGPRLAALCGLGGAGKTSLAVEYAHRHLAEVGVCWQFPAEHPALLAAGYALLAAQLGASDAVEARDPMTWVHGVLARSDATWLLVFDNATSRASIEEFIPPAGPGRVLITTQYQHWPAGQALDVPVLDIDVAADFLTARTGDPDKSAARELAGELGGLPLALEQAAAYVQATGTSLTRYLPLFRDRQAELLARGEAAGHPMDVAATLGLALSSLAEATPVAAGLMRLLAFLAPEPVPLALLLAGGAGPDLPCTEAADAIRPLLGDPVAIGDAVAALRSYSLVTPAGDGLVLVHRLVAAVTRAQLSAPAAAQWRDASAAVVESAVPADAESPEAWQACASLLSHARAVLNLTSDGIWRIAWSLGRSGSYPAALALFSLIADARTNDDAQGPGHPRTLTARHALAFFTGVGGDAAAARDQFAALLPSMERVLSPDHPKTLSARHNLARWTGGAGDAAGARDQLTVLLPVRERILGPEHPDTLTTRGELAFWTGRLGDAVAARDQLAALMPVSERVLGPDHHDTLINGSELAFWIGEAGDPVAARDQLTANLPVIARTLGPEHPDTLATREQLAHWVGRAGDPGAARDQLAALLPIRERVLGLQHPHTLSTRHELAHWVGKLGDPVEARDQLTVLLLIRERVLGPRHPDTLATRRELAHWTTKAGDAVSDAQD